MQNFEITAAAYAEYVRHFNLKDYAAAFSQYDHEYGKFFPAEDADRAVDALMAFAEKELQRKWGRSARQFDLRSFFCAFLCPCAMKNGAPGLAEALNAAWNKAYPTCGFPLMSYEELAGGFRDKPFGF